MPTLEVKTTEARQTWKSPDGKITMFELTLDYEGKPVTAKTYSQTIATVGWEGTVETYEKAGRNGVETFVKQPPKEDGGYNNSQGGSKPAYQPKDEAAIKAMWSISQAVQLFNSQETKPSDDVFATLESYAQELFLMVERVKVVTEGTKPDEPLTIAEIEKVMGPVEDLGKLVKDA